MQEKRAGSQGSGVPAVNAIIDRPICKGAILILGSKILYSFRNRQFHIKILQRANILRKRRIRTCRIFYYGTGRIFFDNVCDHSTARRKDDRKFIYAAQDLLCLLSIKIKRLCCGRSVRKLLGNGDRSITNTTRYLYTPIKRLKIFCARSIPGS